MNYNFLPFSKLYKEFSQFLTCFLPSQIINHSKRINNFIEWPLKPIKNLFISKNKPFIIIISKKLSQLRYFLNKTFLKITFTCLKLFSILKQIICKRP